ncbi:prostate stem cell antigen-like [Bombina bombina]|uniref:prostate stem cell antigen-like n=1 Tax=Bombina bombina TaxID=8345 RepID=UPI00235B1335|nr:prostate stem cell antigen-like [Bombina bombina]
MRTLLTTSILLAGFLGLAYSLQCYSCTDTTENKDCLTVSTCNSSMSYCTSTVVKFLFIKSVTKGCVSSCVSGSESIVIFSGSQTCCSTNLCNNRTVQDLLNSGNSKHSLTNSIFLIVSITSLMSTALTMGL